MENGAFKSMTVDGAQPLTRRDSFPLLTISQGGKPVEWCRDHLFIADDSELLAKRHAGGDDEADAPSKLGYEVEEQLAAA